MASVCRESREGGERERDGKKQSGQRCTLEMLQGSSNVSTDMQKLRRSCEFYRVLGVSYRQVGVGHIYLCSLKNSMAKCFKKSLRLFKSR